jgi:hypothetical protein
MPFLHIFTKNTEHTKIGVFLPSALGGSIPGMKEMKGGGIEKLYIDYCIMIHEMTGNQ